MCPGGHVWTSRCVGGGFPCSPKALWEQQEPEAPVGLHRGTTGIAQRQLHPLGTRCHELQRTDFGGKKEEFIIYLNTLHHALGTQTSSFLGGCQPSPSKQRSRGCFLWQKEGVRALRSSSRSCGRGEPGHEQGFPALSRPAASS